MAEKPDHSDLLSWTTEIVSSHLSNNEVSHNDIPSLIEKTYQSLAGLGGEAGSKDQTLQPAVPIKKSRPFNMSGGRKEIENA